MLNRRTLITAGLGLCGLDAARAQAASHATTDPLVVAFAQDTLKNDFRKAQVAEVRTALARIDGVRFEYSDAQGQTSLLIRQIEQFAARRVGVLVLGTNDERAVVPAVRAAYRAGVAVIVLDRGIQGQDYTTFINSDNVHIGRLGGEFVAQQLKGRGLVLLLEGLQSADVTHLRTQGFMGVMAQHPGLRVVKRTGNYLRKDALLEVEKLLSQGVRFDAIFSESDSMLSGARVALQAAGVDPKGLISVGCDYTREAQAALRAGTQTASVLFPLGGFQTADVVRQILAHQPVEKHIVIPVKLVTRDNVDHETPIF